VRSSWRWRRHRWPTRPAYGLEFSRISDEPYSRRWPPAGRSICRCRRDRRHQQGRTLRRSTRPFHRWATDPTDLTACWSRSRPPMAWSRTLLSLTPERACASRRYQVNHGDTIASIATQYSTTPELLRHLNNMDSKEKPVIGAELLVPSTAIELPEKAMRAAALVDRPGRMGGRRGSRHGLHVVRRGDTAVRYRSPPGDRCRHARAPEQHGGRRSRSAPASVSWSRAGHRVPKPLERATAPAAPAQAPARSPTRCRRGDTSMASHACCRSRCATCWAGTDLHKWRDPPRAETWWPSSTGAVRDGDPGGEAAADRRRRNRPFDRLGASPRPCTPTAPQLAFTYANERVSRASRATGAVAGRTPHHAARCHDR